MPEGVVHWVDDATGDAEVLRDGRAYHVPPGALERTARRVGARVHFDLRRADGVEEAVDVRLRPSAWGARHRRRLGELAGSRGPEGKGVTAAAAVHPELHDGAVHPVQVVRTWATAVAVGDQPGALSLYAPDAAVHAAGVTHRGRDAIARWLQATAVWGCGRHARIRGDGDGTVSATWEAEAPGEHDTTVACRLAHGRIAEQWARRPAEAGPEAPGAPGLAVRTDGSVDTGDEQAARVAVTRVAATVAEPVLFARVKLAVEADPARARPARAEAMLDVNGEPVRARAEARTMPEAVDRLEQRLRDQLEHRARRRLTRRRWSAEAGEGEWRHGDLPTRRAPWFDRPPEERQLVRQKTFAIGELTVDEAVHDMEQLDDDFYLFVDLATGVDSLVEQVDGGPVRLTRLRPSDVPVGRSATPVELSAEPVAVLGVAGAIEQLNASGAAHLFFADEVSGRGCVLYRRADGHYGLIVPE